jgi:hypothetical protein
VVGHLKKELARAQQDVQRFTSASGFGKLGIERAAHFVGVGSSADQLRTEKTVGKGSKGITATEGSDGFGSCEAHHVGISPQKDRGCSKGKVGKGEGW